MPVAVSITLASNIAVAGACYAITFQLVLFSRDRHLPSLLRALEGDASGKDKGQLSMFYSLVAYFAALHMVCGHVFAYHAIKEFVPENDLTKVIQTAVVAVCAVVSLLAAFGGFRLFPAILAVLYKGNQFEPIHDPHEHQTLQPHPHINIRQVGDFVSWAVEVARESVVVFGEDLKIKQCNEASKTLFQCSEVVGSSMEDYLHHDDRRAFRDAVAAALRLHSTQAPVTVEYRVTRETNSGRHPLGAHASPPGIRPKPAPVRPMHSTPKKVHPANGSSSDSGTHTTQSTRSSGSSTQTATTEVEYVWVESIICKGARHTLATGPRHDLLMVSRDITERKRLADTPVQSILRRCDEQAQITMTKLKFISCIAHDLKAPLQSFCFTLDLLQQSRLNAEQHEFAQQASVAVDLMKLTISQTMDITKALSGGKLQPRCDTVALSSVMDRVRIIIQGYGKSVPITFYVAPDVCDCIITDEEWLWQMLLNLLTNACKYTDRGSIEVVVRATSGIKLPSPSKRLPVPSSVSPRPRQTDALLFEVIDTGVGVTGSKIDRLFDAFSQVQEGQVTGTGLGLFGVRTRVEGLHGTCGARHNTSSSTGTGMVVWFAIPYMPDRVAEAASRARDMSRAVSQAAEMGVAAASPGHAGPPAMSTDLSVQSFSLPSMQSLPELTRGMTPMQPSPPPGMPHVACLRPLTQEGREEGLTAIVVDDTQVLRKLMEKLLLRMGFARVDCYENGAKGLDAMLARQVDIVFSDVQMPIMTGPEMAARFREVERDMLARGQRKRRQLIVAVTANSSQAGRQGDPNGFDEVCSKPISAADIQRILHRHLDC